MVYVRWKDYDPTNSVMESNQGFTWNHPWWTWSSSEFTAKTEYWAFIPDNSANASQLLSHIAQKIEAVNDPLQI